MANEARYFDPIVVSEETLTRVLGNLPQILPGLSWHAIVRRRRLGNMEFEDVRSLPTVGNPKDDRIVGIQLSGQKDSTRVRWTYQEGTTTFSAAAEGLPEAAWEELHGLARQEIRNMRAFYWPAFALCRWTSTGWRPWGLLLIYLAFLVPRLAGCFSLDQPDNLPIAGLVEEGIGFSQPSAGEAPGPVTEQSFDLSFAVFMRLLQLLPWLAGISASIGALVFLRYLFPRVVFRIGEGVERHRHRNTWRMVVFTVVVLPLVLETGRSLF